MLIIPLVPPPMQARRYDVEPDYLQVTSWPTAAIPVDNPYCSCKLTRVRPRCRRTRTASSISRRWRRLPGRCCWRWSARTHRRTGTRPRSTLLTSPARRWALRQPFRFISAAPFHFNSAEFPRPSPALPHTVLHIGLPAAARKDVVGCDAVSTPVGPTIQISRRYDIHLQVTLLTKHV